jgi:hypothetical protein
MKFMGEGESKRRIHGAESMIGDAPMLPCLPDQIEADEPMECVIADGTYDTLACHGAMMTIIALRKTARLWDCRSVESGVSTDAVAARHRLGSASWKTCSGHRRRNLPETTMHRRKRIGQRLIEQFHRELK